MEISLLLQVRFAVASVTCLMNVFAVALLANSAQDTLDSFRLVYGPVYLCPMVAVAIGEWDCRNFSISLVRVCSSVCRLEWMESPLAPGTDVRFQGRALL